MCVCDNAYTKGVRYCLSYSNVILSLFYFGMF